MPTCYFFVSCCQIMFINDPSEHIQIWATSMCMVIRLVVTHSVTVLHAGKS